MICKICNKEIDILKVKTDDEEYFIEEESICPECLKNMEE